MCWIYIVATTLRTARNTIQKQTGRRIRELEFSDLVEDLSNISRNDLGRDPNRGGFEKLQILLMRIYISEHKEDFKIGKKVWYPRFINHNEEILKDTKSRIKHYDIDGAFELLKHDENIVAWVGYVFSAKGHAILRSRNIKSDWL